MRLRKLSILGILTLAPACDNVEWGGIDVRLESAADRAAAGLGPTEDSASAPPVEDGLVAEELGPVVLLGRRSGASVTLIPFGHLSEGGIRALAATPDHRQTLAERLAPGRPFTLFSEGARVGSLFVSSATVSDGYCGQRPSVSGTPELVPRAVDAERFLAVASGALTPEYGPYRPIQHNYDQRVGSLNLMVEVIPQVEATFPQSVLEIRRDIRAFQLRSDPDPAIAATFVYGDELQVGAAPRSSYSVFLIGVDRGNGFRPAFVSYRPAAAGKGAPRYFDRLDWDGDGRDEIVLEVFGRDGIWVSVLDEQDGVWTEVYHDPCGTPTRRSEVTP